MCLDFSKKVNIIEVSKKNKKIISIFLQLLLRQWTLLLREHGKTKYILLSIHTSIVGMFLPK